MWKLSESRVRAGASPVPEGWEAVADVLEQIKPGIRDDPARLETYFVLLAAGRDAANPDKKALMRAKAALGKLGQADWGTCVLVAGQYGFRLPVRIERMQAVLDNAAATRKGTTTVRGRRLALDCLAVYVGLAGEPPKVRNAKQHEGSCGLYYDLVQAAFEAESLTNWAERAAEAASDEKRQRTLREQEKAACELWAALEAREPLAD
jgi:hypothetical protein